MPERQLPSHAARGLNAVAWGLVLAFLGGNDIDRLVPICAAAALCDGLLALVAPSRDGVPGAARRWLPAAASLGFGALMAWQPLYSTLSYSFLLLLRWVHWLLGLGLISLAAMTAGTLPCPSLRRPRALGDAVLLAAAIALQLWPGAGMVERGPAAGLALAFWGAMQAADAAAVGKAGRRRADRA